MNELLDSFFALLGAQRFDEWIDLWDDDASMTFPFAPVGVRSEYHGKDAILAYVTKNADRVTLDSVDDQRVLFAEDRTVAIMEFGIKARSTATGRPYDQRFVVFLELRDGKVWRMREYWNPVLSMESFGSDGWIASF